jgi:hypothetical protein
LPPDEQRFPSINADLPRGDHSPGVADAAIAMASGVSIRLHSMRRPEWAGSGRDVRRTRSAKTTHREIVMSQLLQIAGALAVLAGYVLAQLGRLSQWSYPYLLLNFAGSAILAVLALVDRQWGFLLLEGVWAIVSLRGLGIRLRGGEPAATH